MLRGPYGSPYVASYKEEIHVFFYMESFSITFETIRNINIVLS